MKAKRNTAGLLSTLTETPNYTRSCPSLALGIVTLVHYSVRETPTQDMSHQQALFSCLSRFHLLFSLFSPTDVSFYLRSLSFKRCLPLLYFTHTNSSRLSVLHHCAAALPLSQRWFEVNRLTCPHLLLQHVG